jgi:hypothetical protein
MKTINSRLLLASKNAVTGDILYTFVWTYPRIILPEVNTHRMLSRNTASSRAKPTKKVRSEVRRDMFVPTHIGANRKGMQAGDELTGWRRTAAELVWKAAGHTMVAAHYALDKLGVHKQITNRVVEPWTWTEQIVSATELDNLFLLRDHHMAEPHFAELAAQAHGQADAVRDTFRVMERRGERFRQSRGNDFIPDRTVQILRPGEWHLPFSSILDEVLWERLRSCRLPVEVLKKISAARCARVSYNLPDTGERSDIKRDLELFDRLAGSNPKHLSPLEHQAMAVEDPWFTGNFRGFKQFRKEIEGESGTA